MDDFLTALMTHGWVAAGVTGPEGGGMTHVLELRPRASRRFPVTARTLPEQLPNDAVRESWATGSRSDAYGGTSGRSQLAATARWTALNLRRCRGATPAMILT